MKTIKRSIVLGLLIFFLCGNVYAWDDCPRQEVDCTGKCGKFIDKDKDGICDHSQPVPEDR